MSPTAISSPARCAVTDAGMPIAATGDKPGSFPCSGAIKPMPEAEIARAVQLLDLMLEFCADDGHWARSC